MRDLYGDLDLLFFILTGKVSLVINRALMRRFRAEGIESTPDQFAVMVYLWENDGRTQQELCDATNKDKPSMTRMIDNLEKQNLVSRVADRSDRRNNLIYLTNTGKNLKTGAIEAMMEVIRQGLEGITNEQIDTCRVVLNKVLKNLK